jgi:hypothetical protein
MPLIRRHLFSLFYIKFFPIIKESEIIGEFLRLVTLSEDSAFELMIFVKRGNSTGLPASDVRDIIAFL